MTRFSSAVDVRTFVRYAARERFPEFSTKELLVSNNAVQPQPEKDPDDWVTGDEPMTGPQQSYLSTLAQEAKREVPESLTKAEASTLIDNLQQETGRGAE